MGQARQPRRVQTYDGELGAVVARAQDGDETAFAVAYRIVQPGLLGYLRGFVGEDAEDVASDAWLEIARDLGRFKGDGAGFRGWTATIARHRALDHLRRQRVRPRSGGTEQDVLNLPGPHSTHDEALETLSTERALELVRGRQPHRAGPATTRANPARAPRTPARARRGTPARPGATARRATGIPATTPTARTTGPATARQAAVRASSRCAHRRPGHSPMQPHKRRRFPS
ncbi:RNA polymerase sigma factor [Streptomyces phaeochromogenes]|uniref:RNA polymerase sigma factor n=1 Tax=Streptomyces phaeochromogenes TaxID=1923 RepID=UPI0036957320